MRRLLFWIHLCAGISAAAIILIMSATGVLLGFERQIKAWADRKANAPVSLDRKARLSMENLLASMEAAPAAITVHSDPAEAVEVSLGRDRTIFIDPYTGAVLGEGSQATRQFFATMVAWHRWLGASGAARATARGVTGAANLIFLLMVFTGAILWLPSRWRWQAIRPSLLFRSGLKGKARDWNWHNVAGIWLSMPLLFIVATGVVMSYSWANDLLYRITGTEVPTREARPGGPPRGRSGGGMQQWTALDPLVERAKQQLAGWRTISVRPTGETFSFTIDEGDGGQPQKRSQLVLDRKTASVVRWEPFAWNNAGRRLRMWSRFVHTGEAGGWIGQAIATLASGAGVLLVWTGVALSIRRFSAWRARRTRRKEAAVLV